MSRRILVTGFSGFVAKHYLDYLYENEERNGVEILGADITMPAQDLCAYRDKFPVDFQQIDLMDAAAVEKMIFAFVPDQVLHLAAFSSVSYSWQHPADCFGNNTRVFLTVVEAARKLRDAAAGSDQAQHTRILSVGSSEIYGNVDETMLPLREDMTVRPLNPYAIARQAQEGLARIYVDNFGLDIILTRSFNHIGPGQDARFVVPSFIERIRKLKEAGCTEGTIETGDTSIIRDFLDVRDVVRAYDLLLQKGTAGEIYNIASGKGTALSEIIDAVAGLFDIKITGEVDPAFVRPDDNRTVIGSYEKLRRQTGWTPQITLQKTLEDMI